MLDERGSVGGKGERPLKLLIFPCLVIGSGAPGLGTARRSGETTVDFTQILGLVEKRLEIETRIGIPCGLVLDAVAHIKVVHSRPFVPSVGRIIRYVSTQIIKDGNSRERRTV